MCILIVEPDPEKRKTLAADLQDWYADREVREFSSSEEAGCWLQNREMPPKASQKGILTIRALGNFEVLVDGEPLKFRYKKTRELLAYLVDRRGAMLTNNELIGVLWEGESEGAHISYFKNLRADLLRTLREVGCEDAIVHVKNQTGIRTEKVDCDFYRLLQRLETWNRTGAGRRYPYRGEYMSQYSWGENTLGLLEELSVGRNV